MPTTTPIEPEAKHGRWLTAAHNGYLPQVRNHEVVLIKTNGYKSDHVTLYSLTEDGECAGIAVLGTAELRSLVDTLAEALRTLEGDD